MNGEEWGNNVRFVRGAINVFPLIHPSSQLMNLNTKREKAKKEYGYCRNPN